MGSVAFVCFDRDSAIGQALSALAAQRSMPVAWPASAQKAELAPEPGRRSVLHQMRPWLRLALQRLLISFAAARRSFQRRRAANSYRVLFYSSFHQYLDYLKAVVAADFADIFVYNPVVLSWRELLALGVHLLLDRPALVVTDRAAAPWRTRWGDQRLQAQLSARFQPDGLPLWPLAEPILAELFERRFTELADLCQRLVGVLNRVRPNLVIVPQDVHDAPRLLVMLAQAAGIPTLATEHGIIANYPYRVRPLADRIAVWGRGDIAYYLRHGYAPDRITVIGQPVLERLWAARAPLADAAAPGQTDRATPRSRPPGRDPVRRPALCAALRGNSPVEVVDLIGLVIDACRGRPDWRLIVKLHPLMDGSELAQLDTTGANVTIARWAASTPCWPTQILITWSSTAGLEGLVMGKPLISLQIPGKADYVPYVAEGAALGAATSPSWRRRLIAC